MCVIACMQVVFPCNHATCKDCYHRLVGKLLEDDTVCPMCRAPLAEPVPGEYPVQALSFLASTEVQHSLCSKVHNVYVSGASVHFSNLAHSVNACQRPWRQACLTLSVIADCVQRLLSVASFLIRAPLHCSAWLNMLSSCRAKPGSGTAAGRKSGDAAAAVQLRSPCCPATVASA